MRYNLARFDFVSMRLVVLCAATGSLSAATSQMHLALAAGSRRLKEIEDAIEEKLFVRSPRGLNPTRAGQIFVKHTLELLSNIDHLADELSDLREGVSSHISLHASTAAINQFIPELLQSFAEHRPEVKVDLFERDSHSVISALREGRCDLGVFVEGPNTEDLTVANFRRDELVLVMPRDHRLARERKSIVFADTLQEDYVGLASGAAVLQSQQNAAIAAGKVLKLRMQVQSFDAVCHLVASRLGIAVLPLQAIGPLARGMNLTTRKLSDKWARRQLHIARRSECANRGTVEFMDFMVKSSIQRGKAAKA
jgi:DNA-binding transcriptional LysR family regulator